MISLPAILEEKCAILLREKISFAGLINKSGRLVAGGLKVGLTPIVDEFEREKLFMEYVLMASMRKDFDYCLGRVKYTASKGEKMTMMSFPIGSFLFLVAVDPRIDIEKEANKIEKIIKNFVSFA
jgi:hypothetical protein